MVWAASSNFSSSVLITPFPEELNEEDQQLKNELEMLVSRLKA